MLKETFHLDKFSCTVTVGAQDLYSTGAEHQESESMMTEEEAQVKRTVVYPQVHHLEEQLVFPFISLLCYPFFAHTLRPPTTSHNCSSSHLYLITAESAAVNRPHHNTWCSFARNTAQLIFTLRMNWLRLEKKRHQNTGSLRHIPAEGEILPLTLRLSHSAPYFRRFYLYALNLPNAKSKCCTSVWIGKKRL